MKHLSVVGLILLAFDLSLASAGAYTDVVSFGDSLSDYGNNGINTTGPATTPSSQIGSVWCQQLSVNLLGLPFAKSSGGGSDYAVSGAVTSDMASQVSSYLTSHPTASATALYTFWGGGNDIDNYAEDHPTDSVGLQTTATAAVSNIEAQITSVANAGGKTFIWVNMPPLSQTPAAAAHFGAQASTILDPPMTTFNTQCAHAISALRTQFPDITIVEVDVNTLFNNAIANPSSYGLVNVTTGCEGLSVNADTYLFWDDFHPTSRGHQVIAAQAYSLLPNQPGYSGWTELKGLTDDNALPTTVIAHDGLTNLYKYALGLNPQTNYNPGGSLLPLVRTENFSGTPYLTLTFTGVATDVTYMVQATSDLAAGWTTIKTYGSGGAAAPGTVTVQDVEPKTTYSQRFMRLLMTSP